MPVSATTRLTSIWGVCVLISLLLAGFLEGRVNKRKVVVMGSWGAVAALGLIAASGLFASLALFYSGVVFLGLATGISTVSNLSLMLDMTLKGSAGLFIGAWGVANALARAVGTLASGIIRDLASQLVNSELAGYIVVFSLQVFMLLGSLWLLRSIDVTQFKRGATANLPSESVPLVERMTLSQDA
jgi:BCD family chlorophyll transporter-like MFS transporter